MVSARIRIVHSCLGTFSSKLILVQSKDRRRLRNLIPYWDSLHTSLTPLAPGSESSKSNLWLSIILRTSAEAAMLQLIGQESAMRTRVAVSVAIGLASAAFCWLLLAHFHQGAADFTWAIRAARSMLAGRNPYDTPYQQYPLTAAFFALPFVWLRPELAGALFYGVSSGLLAFGMTRHGYHRLLVFLAYPYWAGILTAQWAPLITASAFFPLLLPVTMAKPQIGLPVALNHLSRRGVVACLVVAVLSLIVMPHWPLWWAGQFGYYQHFIPLLVLPGPLLALALLRLRDRDVFLLLTAAVMPQRWFFDALILWLIPKTRREIVWTAGLSWGAGIWRWYHTPQTMQQVGLWSVLFLYLPMLVVVLLRPADRQTKSVAAQ